VLLADFDRDVAAIAAQPFLLQAAPAPRNSPATCLFQPFRSWRAMTMRWIWLVPS
jgi:hypothetical protein